MTHLFLTSSIGIPGVGESIRASLGHDKNLKTSFISTPVEGEFDKSDLSWVEEEKNGLSKNGFEIFDYTITGKNLMQIKEDLKDIDVLYISGGNNFYLKEKSNESGFDEFVKEFVATGKIYIGTSCGSQIMSKDMSSILSMTDLDLLSSPVDTQGFGLVDFTIIPHWGSDDFKDNRLSQISIDQMFSSSSPLIALNNFEYVEVVDDQYRIIDVRIKK
jgi:dipeptidase E